MGMEQEELAAALRSHGDRLMRSAYLLCGNLSDAEDIVQETFLQAIRSIHRFENRAKPYTWLHAILLNINRHHYRDNKRMVYDAALAEREAPFVSDDHQQLDDTVISSVLGRALQKLSSDHREIIVLRYFENMKIQDMAAHLEVSSGTVKSRLHYAIEELRKIVPPEMNLFGDGGTEKIRQ
jgi:RNA polymerase sigma-70 factor (ECF subfamily)